jgi:hypothetical protein
LILKNKSLRCKNPRDSWTTVPDDTVIVEPKYIVNPKIKHLQAGDTLSKCPNCGVEQFAFTSKITKITINTEVII